MSHREGRAELGLGHLQGGLQFLTAWASLPSTLLVGEWEGVGGAWERDPALPEPGDPALRSAGEEELR